MNKKFYLWDQFDACHNLRCVVYLTDGRFDLYKLDSDNIFQFYDIITLDELNTLMNDCLVLLDYQDIQKMIQEQPD